MLRTFTRICEHLQTIVAILPIKLHLSASFSALCGSMSSAFGGIAQRMLPLSQHTVDLIMSFASNELHRPVHRPLAIQTYVVLNLARGHAAATIKWLQARSEAWWQAGRHRAPTIGRLVACEGSGRLLCLPTSRFIACFLDAKPFGS